jgi:hypothetical protein
MIETTRKISAHFSSVTVQSSSLPAAARVESADVTFGAATGSNGEAGENWRCFAKTPVARGIMALPNPVLGGNIVSNNCCRGMR